MREAVDGAAEELVVGAVADAEVGGAGPLDAVGGVGGGEGGDGAGGAVGDEGGVGGDVGDEVVEGGCVVWEDAGGGEGLEGGEGVGDEGAGLEGGGWAEEERSRGGFHGCGWWVRGIRLSSAVVGGCWVTDDARKRSVGLMSLHHDVLIEQSQL